MPTFTVETTLNPGVLYDVEEDEYQQLVEQGYVVGLEAVVVPADKVIVSPTEPTSPAVGQVWFNTTIP